MADSSESGGASVRRLGRASEADEERLLWSGLRDAPDQATFRRSWLALQCSMIEGARAAALFGESGSEGALAPLATWPPAEESTGILAVAARKALAEGHGVALEIAPTNDAQADAGHCVIAQPHAAADGSVRVAAVEVSPRPAPALERALRRLGWGVSRLELEEERIRSRSAGRLESLLQLVAAPLEHDRFRSAATAFASELASQLGFDRVSFGTLEHDRVTVRAVSHSARFAERANLTRAVEGAMHEAIDQEVIVVWPPPDEPISGVGRDLVTRAHEGLAVESNARTLCSVPLAHGARFCGAVTCERGGDRPITAEEVELLEAAVALAGPLLDIQHRDDRWIGAKLSASLKDGFGEIVGPRHVGAKVLTAVAAVLLVFVSFVDGDFRVRADATLEAEVLRAAVAPFDGYVLEAPARAGDIVSEGDLLARLDDRDLVLERARWASEVLQLEPRMREAMADRNAAEVQALQAKLDQARAQLDLAESRLEKTQLVAAFDGVVATGDLSQQLGAPVSRGDVLYEVAPLDEYRLSLAVDEKDVDELRVGQRGELVFSALPGEGLGFEVVSITPVSEAGEGRNTFRVEARLDEMPAHLRPGMEGVAKVEIGERRLVWIWTREAVDWLRLAAWRWLP